MTPIRWVVPLAGALLLLGLVANESHDPALQAASSSPARPLATTPAEPEERPSSASPEILPAGLPSERFELPAGSLHGRVVRAESGQAVPRFLVNVLVEEPGGGFLPFAFRQTSVTSEAGEFRVEGLAEGLYRLEVLAQGLAPSVALPVLLREGESVGAGEIELAEAAALRGFVTAAEDGLPLADALVRIRFSDERFLHRAFEGASGPDGAFTIRDLPAGLARFEVESGGRRPVSLDVVLHAGRPTEILDVRLEPEPMEGTE